MILWCLRGSYVHVLVSYYSNCLLFPIIQLRKLSYFYKHKEIKLRNFPWVEFSYVAWLGQGLGRSWVIIGWKQRVLYQESGHLDLHPWLSSFYFLICSHVHALTGSTNIYYLLYAVFFCMTLLMPLNLYDMYIFFKNRLDFLKYCFLRITTQSKEDIEISSDNPHSYTQAQPLPLSTSPPEWYIY